MPKGKKELLKLAIARRRKKEKRVTIIVTDAMHFELKLQAVKRRCCMNDLIVLAINKYFHPENTEELDDYAIDDTEANE